MAWDGQWTRRAIIRMLPQAIKVEADQSRMQFAAVSAAIAGAFSKNGAKPFLESLEKVDSQVKASKEQAPKRQDSPAKQTLAIFKKFGLNLKGMKR